MQDRPTTPKEGLDFDLVKGTLKTQGDALNHLYQHALAQKAKEDFAQVKSDAVQKLQAADIPASDDLVGDKGPQTARCLGQPPSIRTALAPSGQAP